MDVKSVFLNGELKLRQAAARFCHRWEGGEGVAALQGTVRALSSSSSLERQVGRHNGIARGFQRSSSEHAVYVRGNLIVSVYVDDLVISGSKRDEIELFKTEMKNSFHMSDLGFLSYYPGIEVC
jgi:hypothetical protein